ncbi:MAG: M23 family metallopeptidase [Chloroflexi bacterium]|nr:MAG: M23 family metallopeptidase [Chloroflexota bacterium]
MLKKIVQYTLIFALITSLASIATPSSANAAPGNIESPFDAGSAWNICQGYNNSRGTHTGTSSISLDISGGPNCDNSASGRNIRAPFSGTVAWYVSGSGSVCLNSLSGISVMLTHINGAVSQGASVTVGQIVGTIAAPGQKQNNGVSHLHIQAWSRTGCTDDTKRITFDDANNAHMCGAPNMTLSGSGWNYEGMSYTVKSLTSCSANESVYRFYSQQLKTHLYTIDENEKNFIANNFPVNVWSYEGVSFCASAIQETDTKPVYRFYSQQLKTHLYTVDENEKNTIIGWNNPEVWKFEGISYYAKTN